MTEASKKFLQENQRALSFLQESRPHSQSLGCGCHQGIYYFGTKLFKDKRAYDAVVTSDGRIFINDVRRDGKTYQINKSLILEIEPTTQEFKEVL